MRLSKEKKRKDVYMYYTIHVLYMYLDITLYMYLDITLYMYLLYIHARTCTPIEAINFYYVPFHRSNYRGTSPP